MPNCAAFVRMMAVRVSRSGGCTSASRPPSSRVHRRSSRRFISFGGRSEVTTICFPASYRQLKVWKNSSCVLSLPAMNWISSMSSRSALRYFWRKFSAVPVPMDLTI